MIVYFHRNPTTKEVFYVGIGQDRRRAHVMIAGRNIYFKRYVAKYGQPIIEIVHDNVTKEEACELEIGYIKQFGKKINGGLLVNLSDGGEISSLGVKHTAETKAKVSAAQIGRKQTAEQIAKTRSIQRDPVMRARQAAHKIGKKQSDEQKKKISEANIGRIVTDLTRSKISIANKGKVRTEEAKAKYRIMNKGRKERPESKEKRVYATKKVLLNTQTGVFYHGMQEAADSIGMKISTFRVKMAGFTKTKPPFIYA